MTSDREDWPTLGLQGYDQPVKVPAHPKVNSLRARVNFNVSHIKDGIPLPCCYRTRFPTRQTIAVGYRQGTERLFSTFAYNQVPGNPEPDDDIRVWNGSGEVLRVGSLRNVLLFTGYEWNRFSSEWLPIKLRIQAQFGEFPWNVGLEYEPFEGAGFEFTYRSGIQCYLDPRFWQPSDLPDDGPPGYQWPPAFDDWWTGQF